MPSSTKELALRAVTSYPIYRFMPPSSLRTYAAFRYHDARSPRGRAAGLARQLTTSGVRYLSTGVIAARAAFRTGHDDVVEQLLADLEGRFPQAPAPFELRADLHAHRGEYAVALQAAKRARLLQPSRATAVAKVVRYGYEVLTREEADEVSVAALRRFPFDQSVMWAVGKCCFSREQAERVVATWREIVLDQAQLPIVVSQLATAATRGRRADLACELYREAIIAVDEDPWAVRPVTPGKLEGKGAWAAIEDVADALGEAGVPYFFAAGTTLGLVREGRPLALDGDIDVGVFDADWDTGTLRDLFRKDPRFVLDPNPMSSKVGLKHRGGSPIDIFCYYEEDGRVWHDGVFVRWDNTPFTVEMREISGRRLPIPADAETYLTENYGDWRVPNPGYDVFTEAPNFHVRWPEYGHMHRLREAFRSLTAGNKTACEKHLQAVGESDLLDRLGGEQRRPVLPTGDEVPADSPVNGDDRMTRPSGADILNSTDDDAGALGATTEIASLDSTIRDRGWLIEPLWERLASQVATPSDYDTVRRLWLDIPDNASYNVAILRSVAYAAAVAGDHDESQALLRRAIILSARRARRPRAVAARVVRQVGEFLSLASRQNGHGDFTTLQEVSDAAYITATYVELLAATVSRRKKDARKIAADLQVVSAEAWLEAFA